MRKFIIAGATLVLLAVGLVIGSPAHAGFNSGNCKVDNWPTTTQVVDNPSTGPYLAVEWYNSSWTGGNADPTADTWVAICYSDTPGLDQSDAVGGVISVRVAKVGANTYWAQVLCDGDSPTWLTTVRCNTEATTTTTTSTSTSPVGAGADVAGFFLVNGSTLTLGTTGGHSGALSATTGGNPDATYGGTCVVAGGLTLVGCGGPAMVDARAATGDLIPGTPTGSICLVSLGGSCVVPVPRTGVILFQDAANPTDIAVLGTTVLSDPGTVCLGVC